MVRKASVGAEVTQLWPVDRTESAVQVVRRAFTVVPMETLGSLV